MPNTFPQSAIRVSDPILAATEQRLIEAAGEVFAEHGFRAATIRDICRRAKANIAAVNYHFGDKERLYAAVLRYAHQCAAEQYPVADSTDPDQAAERLRTFVRSLMRRMLDSGRPAWHGKLMIREMTDPTAALDSLVEESIRPHFNLLNSIIRDIVGPNVNARTVELAAASVIGQCTFYRHAQAVVVRLNSTQTFEPEALDALSDHITDFSLVALKAMRVNPPQPAIPVTGHPVGDHG